VAAGQMVCSGFVAYWTCR